MTISATPLLTGLLVFLRFLGMLTTAPVMGTRTFPWRMRIGVAVGAAVLTSAALPVQPPLPDGLLGLGLLGVAEVVLGLAVGLVAAMFIHGVRMAGQLAGIQMGLGFSAMVDPTNGEQTTILARLLGLTATLVILALNGHLLLLRGLSASFNQLPPGAAWASLGRTAIGVPQAGATLFTTAVVVAAPALVVVFSLKMGMAVMARAAPQLHILAVGFIVTIVVGVVTIALTLTEMGETLRLGFERAAGRALDLCAVSWIP